MAQPARAPRRAAPHHPFGPGLSQARRNQEFTA